MAANETAQAVLYSLVNYVTTKALEAQGIQFLDTGETALGAGVVLKNLNEEFG